MTLRTLNYGNYGIFLIMGNAGFCPSAVEEPSWYPLEELEARREARTRVDSAPPPSAPPAFDVDILAFITYLNLPKPTFL